eukprot:6637764-Prorocentrum_lima.AAC.1
MTSSLVGSEMCIRDRTSQSKVDVAGMLRVPEGMPEEVKPGLWRGRLSCCLLYTSDAADDM